MFTKRFKAFKIGPIQIYVDAFWFVAFFLFSWVVYKFYVNQLPTGNNFILFILAIISIFFLYFSLIAHELAHSFVSIKLGIPVKQITLWFLGAAAHLEKNPEEPNQEFKMAIVGPLVNFIISGLLYGLSYFSIKRGITSKEFFLVVNYLIWINLVIGLFNLLPAFPMDGGRILRSIVWFLNKNQIKATRIAVKVAWCLASLMAVISLIYFGVGSIWFVLIAFFIIISSFAELDFLITKKIRKKLSRIKVSELMKPANDVDAEIWKSIWKKEPIFCQINTTIMDVVRIMESKQINNVFVKKDNNVIGEISWLDIYLKIK